MTHPDLTLPAPSTGGHTPGPWRWEIHDGSMASLAGPDGMRDHVLSVSPCNSCQREGWKWGRCSVPSEADADLIAAAPDLFAALTKLLDHYVGLANSGDAGFWDPEKEPEVIAARQALAAARADAGRGA